MVQKWWICITKLYKKHKLFEDKEGIVYPWPLPISHTTREKFFKKPEKLSGSWLYTFLQSTKFSFWQNCSNLETSNSLLNRIFRLEYSRNTMKLKHWSVWHHYKLADTVKCYFLLCKLFKGYLHYKTILCHKVALDE